MILDHQYHQNLWQSTDDPTHCCPASLLPVGSFCFYNGLFWGYLLVLLGGRGYEGIGEVANDSNSPLIGHFTQPQGDIHPIFDVNGVVVTLRECESPGSPQD